MIPDISVTSLRSQYYSPDDDTKVLNLQIDDQHDINLCQSFVFFMGMCKDKWSLDGTVQYQ